MLTPQLTAQSKDTFYHKKSYFISHNSYQPPVQAVLLQLKNQGGMLRYSYRSSHSSVAVFNQDSTKLNFLQKLMNTKNYFIYNTENTHKLATLSTEAYLAAIITARTRRRVTMCRNDN